MIEDHVRAASSPDTGASEIMNGLVWVAAALTRQVSEATGQTRAEVLQDLGVGFADRHP
ncbi:hypothetical protein [Micromonospora sp. NPDC005113]